MADQKQAALLVAALGMIEALEFYADPDSYFALMVVPDHPCGEFAYDSSRLTDEETQYYTDYRDGQEYHGKRAREALATWRKAVSGDDT